MHAAIIEVQDIELDGLMSCASLLFAAGTRPDRQALREFAARDRKFAVSLEPVLASGPLDPDPGGRGDWVELVIHGLTFDLSGLAPRRPAPLPKAGHLFGLPPDFSDTALEALTLVPGPHLAGGVKLLPVLRSHALLCACLAALPGIAAVAWHPARTWNGPEFFRTNVLRWIDGGAFPALGLTALNPTGDGGMASEGLALFTGQELELEPSLAADRVQGARTAFRLMHWLVENGTIDAPETLTGPSGELLRLEPTVDRRLIKVWKT